MEEKKRLSNQLIGSAGEYFVAGELARHGLVAALTVAGTDSFDILAVNNDTGETFAIQVKTTKDKDSKMCIRDRADLVLKPNQYNSFSTGCKE